MKSAIFASLLATAAAFAPAAQKASSTSLQAFEDDIGAIGPVGFFDPLGLVASGDQARFDRLRFVELKHGRISMLAVVGYLTNAGGKYLSGDISLDGTKFSDCGYGIDALTKVPALGLAQVFAFVGFLELFVMKDVTGTGEFVGDFRNDYIDFGWDSFDEETKIQKRAVELNQGRAAMMGILGLMVHEELGNVSDLFFRP